MENDNKQIEFKGKSGKVYAFAVLYDLSKNEHPQSAGIYAFTKENFNENHTVLDVQLLMDEDEIAATAKRMKEDGAAYAFFKACNDELACDAELDDIKEGEDYRSKIE